VELKESYDFAFAHSHEVAFRKASVKGTLG
jgi:hypothetical protein